MHSKSVNSKDKEMSLKKELPKFSHKGKLLIYLTTKINIYMLLTSFFPKTLEDLPEIFIYDFEPHVTLLYT